MKVLICSALLFLLGAAAASAQTPVTNARQHIAWDQDVSGTGATLADVRQYIYRGYVDGAVQPAGGVQLINVTCVAGGLPTDPFVCSADWPALVPGPHTIAVSAANNTGESLPSIPLAFTYQVVIPNVPKKVRVG